MKPSPSIFLGRDVRAREGYSYPEAETNFRTISCFRGRANKLDTPPGIAAPIPKAHKSFRAVSGSPRCVSRRFAVADNVASVRLMKESRKGEETRVTHWVSNRTFPTPTRRCLRRRLINPLGFLVSVYCADPEVVP